MSSDVSFPASASCASIGAARPPKEAQDLVEYAIPGHILGDDLLEDVGVANLVNPGSACFASIRQTIVWIVV
jgi:hypothetical protein